MVWYESLQIVSELIPDLSVWFVWSHNPVGHNEDVVSVWFMKLIHAKLSTKGLDGTFYLMSCNKNFTGRSSSDADYV